MKAYFARSKGYIIKKSAGSLVCISQNNSSKVILNQSSSSLWQLADGQKSLEDIIFWVENQYPNQQILPEKIQSSLEELCHQGLLIQGESPMEVQPILQIGFCNMDDDFNSEDNFIIASLQKFITPFLVNPFVDQADIIFYGEQADAIDDHQYLDRNDVLKIAYITQEASWDESQFDFALTSFPAQSEKIFTFPAWIAHFDWNSLHADKNIPNHHQEALLADLHQVGSAIIIALRQQAMEEDGSFPPALTRPKRNVGKVSDYSKIKKGQLTIGMATYDDYDGVYFTLQAIRLYHPEVLDRLSFIVVDNNPDTAVGEALKAIGDSVPNYTYIPFREYNSTIVRDIFFREAQTEYVMSVDSHIMIVAGAIKKLLDYLDARPDCMDLIQGPLLYDDMQHISSDMQPRWGQGMFGKWNSDPRAKDPEGEAFPIEMHGLGLFACRKEAWPGFNPRFRGFGGEEGYIHEKFRQAGRQSLCMPALRWVHRFGRPGGTKYPNIWNDRIRNYLIGFEELGWDNAPVIDHFSKHLGAESISSIIPAIINEMNSPWIYFDAIYYIYPQEEPHKWENFKSACSEHNLDKLPRPYPIPKDNIPTLHYDKIRNDLIDRSVKLGFDHVVIIDDRSSGIEAFSQNLQASIQQMKAKTWRSFYMGNNEEGLIYSKLFEIGYVPEKERPEKSYISAHNLTYFYDFALDLREKEQHE